MVPVIIQWLSSIICILSAISIFIFMTMHLMKLFSDYCTNERTAISHIAEESKPDQNDSARWLLGLITGLCIIMFFLAALYTAIIYSFTSTKDFCVGFSGSILYSFQIAKGLLYVIMILRLKYIYGNDAKYGFSNKFIAILLLIILICTIVLTVLQNSVVGEAEYFIDNDTFPLFCDFNIADWVLAAMAAFDFAVAVVAIYLFSMKLKSLEQEHSDYYARMKKTATAYYIIVVINSISTVGFLVVIIVTNYSFLCAIDYFFSVIVVMLFSPYYPSINQFLRFPTLIEMKNK